MTLSAQRHVDVLMKIHIRGLLVDYRVPTTCVTGPSTHSLKCLPSSLRLDSIGERPLRPTVPGFTATPYTVVFG